MNDLDQGSRAAQLSGLEVLIETQTQTLLPAVLTICLRPPSDLSKIRLMSSVAAIRNVNTIVACIPKLLPGLIDVGVLGLRATSSGTTPSIAGIEDRTILNSFDPDVVSREVARAATRLFKRVPEENVRSMADVLTQTLLQDVSPMGDLSAAGKHKIRTKLIELEKDSENNSLNYSDDSILFTKLTFIEKKPNNQYKRATILQLVDLFVQTCPNDFIMPLIPQLLSSIVPMALCDPSEVVQEIAIAAFGTLVSLIKRQDATGQIVEVSSI